MDNYHHHARLTIVRREELAKRVLEGGLRLMRPRPSSSSAGRVRRSGLGGIASRVWPGSGIAVRVLIARHAARRGKSLRRLWSLRSGCARTARYPE